LIDIDQLINLFDFDVFNVKFDKDIKRYNIKYPKMRRYSYFEIEDKLYKETYEKLEENYALDQKEFNIGQNDAEI
jgi:hypothetical protein